MRCNTGIQSHTRKAPPAERETCSSDYLVVLCSRLSINSSRSPLRPKSVVLLSQLHLPSVKIFAFPELHYSRPLPAPILSHCDYSLCSCVFFPRSSQRTPCSISVPPVLSLFLFPHQSRQLCG